MHVAVIRVRTLHRGVGEELPREPHKLEKLVRLRPPQPRSTFGTSSHAIDSSNGRTSACHAECSGFDSQVKTPRSGHSSISPSWSSLDSSPHAPALP